jgi:hypothetical protein
MMSYRRPLTGSTFHPGRVVVPADDLVGVQAEDGRLVPLEALGPGLVEQVAPDGRVGVRWLTAEFVAWMDPTDLCASGDDAHLISVYQCDGHGSRILQRRTVVEAAGLAYNWTIERRPRHIVRAVRSDGLAWTFRWSPLWKVLTADWSEPPEDADAEALTAAELAVR